MILSTYDNFRNAIKWNEVKNAENIFASSDIRCSLISYSLEYCERDTVVSIVKSFTSKGLKEQALKICNNCSIQNCKIKQEMLEEQNITYYTSERNRLFNKKHRANDILEERIFDIHSGEYTKKENI